MLNLWRNQIWRKRMKWNKKKREDRWAFKSFLNCIPYETNVIACETYYSYQYIFRSFFFFCFFFFFFVLFFLIYFFFCRHSSLTSGFWQVFVSYGSRTVCLWSFQIIEREECSLIYAYSNNRMWIKTRKIEQMYDNSFCICKKKVDSIETYCAWLPSGFIWKSSACCSRLYWDAYFLILFFVSMSVMWAVERFEMMYRHIVGKSSFLFFYFAWSKSIFCPSKSNIEFILFTLLVEIWSIGECLTNKINSVALMINYR